MTDILLAAIDNGNGKSAGVSSAMKSAINNVVRFEPVFAPASKRRGVDDGKPTFTLRVDGQLYVFGVDDVFAHGKRDLLRRPNNQERYGSADYMMLFKVILLQIFAQFRGKDAIKPTLILTIPIEQYNDPDLVADLKESIAAIKVIEDQDGCILRLSLEAKNIRIIPESTGAFAHYSYDAKTLNPRSGSSTTGITAVLDVGFLTTNVSLYENSAYQKDRGFTIERGGFGLVVNEVWAWAKSTGRDFDLSRVDKGLHAAAGIAPKKKKEIDLGGGVRLDVSPVYDPALDDLAKLISVTLMNAYKETITRVLLTGGGVYHLERALRDMLDIPVVTAPDPELANVLGAYTLLRQQAAKKGIVVTD